MAERKTKETTEKESEKVNGSTSNDTQVSSGSQSTGIFSNPLVTAAARISSTLPLGAPRSDLDLCNIRDGNETLFVAKDITCVPGIMALDFVPTLGYSNDNTSALSRAVDTQFNAIRSQISGNRPYAPVDHMIYRIAVDSLRELYMYVTRIYKILAVYSATNLYKPRAVLTAMGLDFDDWHDNMNSLYFWLIEHASSLEAYPTVPIGTISQRREIFNTYLFTDGEIGSAQTYIINQKYFYSYEKVDEVKGLTPRHIGSTYASFIAMWNTMYTGLNQSSDVYTIAADIRRAFPNTYINSLPMIGSPQDKVEYVKLDPALLSIMNANILADDPGDMGMAFRVYDDNGVLKCTPRIELSVGATSKYVAHYMAPTRHLNSITLEPDAADVTRMTRWTPVIENVSIEVEGSIGSGGFVTTADITSFGSEVIIGARIINSPTDASSVQRIAHMMDSFNKVQIASIISNFDWHPPVYLVETTVSEGGLTAIYPYCLEDIQNYIPVSDEQLRMIHNAVLLAEFGF